MKKSNKPPYEEARLEVTLITDFISTSGENDNFDDDGWTH